jgi:hypothetical protein
LNCINCSDEISPARLKAIPSAKLCIECARKNDVPKIRRFDDHSEDNTSETYFIHNPYLEEAINVFMNRSHIPINDEGITMSHKFEREPSANSLTQNLLKEEEFYTMEETPLPFGGPDTLARNPFGKLA